MRILRENLAHQELLGESESFDFGESDVHELSFSVVAQVVVAEEGVGAEVVGQRVPVLLERLLVQVIADADCATDDEVHLEDFLLFVVDHVLVFLLAEVAGLQAKGNVIQEFAVLILLGLEEESEVVEDVIEQVVDNDAAFDRARQRVDELVVLLNLTETIVSPVVLEVLVDLAIEGVGKSTVVTEASQEGHPVVKLEGLLLDTQVLVEGRNDLDERSHDEGEETDTSEHDTDTEDHLDVGDGVQVTVSHCRQCCDREVARSDELVGVRVLLLVQRVFRDESVPFIVKLSSLQVGDEVECAAGEESDNDGEQDQTEHLVDVVHDQLEDHTLASGLTTEHCLHDLVEARQVQ